MFHKNGKRLWNDNWHFVCKDLGTSLAEMEGESAGWEEVELPHDWLIGDTRNLYRDSEGWYRKKFFVTEEELSESHEIVFDGVYMNTTVYVNGNEVGQWKYGYSGFQFEISPYLKKGENTVFVRVQHESPNTRWYSGAGIYRNVWMTVQPTTHIENYGLYISPQLTSDGWVVRAVTEYTGNIDSIRYTLLDSKKHEAAQVMSDAKVVIPVKNVQLWSVKAPKLYYLKAELIKDKETIDECIADFGFRIMEYLPDEGFKLNGEHMKFKGVCLHHDQGALGAAFNVRAVKRQLMIMKDMGVNAIRTSHNPPAPEFADLCDEMGFLLMTEAFDMWELPKNNKDYARFFPEWYQKDVESWVRRDRNHPSLLFWSIGNEILDTHTSLRGLEVAKMLKDEVRKYDYYENAPVTMASNYMQGENAPKVADELKYAGYNYAERLYDKHHEEHPDWFIYGSETASTVRSRGIYHFPADQPVLTHEDLQCSDLGNSKPAWAGESESALIMDRDRSWCGGQFIWTGMDYIGEPTPYQTKNSYFGVTDTAGFPKSGFYLYKEMWNEDASPFVKLFPHWDWNEGQMIDVISYSNQPEVELFLNGVSLGKQKIDLKKGKVLHAHWVVPFQKGELLIQAYDEKGNVTATDRKVSFSDAVSLKTKCDAGELQADGRDLKYITITAHDKDGNPVENANNRVTVKVSGAGRLVGLDNGDSADYDSYKGNNRRLFNGMLLAIVQTGFESGTVTVEVLSKGLESASVSFEVKECDRPEGVTVCSQQSALTYVQPFADEIPVRKIELTAEYTTLNEEIRSTRVWAKCYPANADWQEMFWKCVDIDGNEVNFASVVSLDDGSAQVYALGDGDFYLRAACRNGKNYNQITSDLNMSITGLGEAVCSAYAMNAANSRQNDTGLGFVIQRGGVMARERMVFTYPNVEFGKNGSNQLVFEGGNPYPNEVPVEVWAGEKGASFEESVKIAEFGFAGNGMYDNYGPQMVALEQKITGVKSISFVVNRLVFGGFHFVDERAFSKIYASENLAVYGDAYKKAGDCVEQIGNNVILEFGTLDLGEAGTSMITVCGKTLNQSNSIQMRCTDENGETVVQLMEFNNAFEYKEQRFEIEAVNGKQKISFIFLPGSNFDFQWFRFER